MKDPMLNKVIALVAEERSLSPNTAEAYKSTLRRLSAYAGSTAEALGITAEEALEWVESIKDSASEHDAYYHAHRASAIFSALANMRIIEENPFTLALVQARQYKRNELYEDAVTLPEIRAIIDHATDMALGELSTISQIKCGTATLLHVKYCIPLSSIANLKMRDYVKTASDSILEWRNRRPAETCRIALDKTTASCLDRLVGYRRDASPDDPILVQSRGKHKGGPYKENNMRCIASRVYKEAGVHVGQRNLKIAAARLAAESGANAAEIKGITSGISPKLAYTVAKEQAQMPAGEIWDRLEMEYEHKLPIVRGRVSASELKEALRSANGADAVDFTVTSTGKLVFPQPEGKKMN